MKYKFKFFFSVWFSFSNFIAPLSAQAAAECHRETVPTPPIFVVPTGYDAKADRDAIETGMDQIPVGKSRQKQYANYYRAYLKTEDKFKPYIVPKRSIVRVSASYKKLIDDKGEFTKPNNQNGLIPVQIISLPAENKKVQESRKPTTKKVGSDPDISTRKPAVGDVGYMKFTDLEKIEKQKDYIFMVKRDSALFTALTNDLNRKQLKSLEPYALKLMSDGYGYLVNRCCDGDECTDHPIFEVLNVRDKNDRSVAMERASDCFFCENSSTLQDLTPIQDFALNPLRSILSHPSLGLPKGAVAEAASVADIQFVDSRGFVKIPLVDKDDNYRTGPFKSLHYGPESGDADVYMKPDVACGFMQFLKSWNTICNGVDDCQIEFGDASHAFHKNCTTNSSGECTNPWPHSGHTNGECIDINTSRMNAKYLTPMLESLKTLGSTGCRSKLGSLKRSGCTYDESHPTHVHICFPSNVTSPAGKLNNPALKQACEKGIPSPNLTGAKK